MFDLAGEVALVTGGSKGIGKGIAKALKQARAKIIIGDIDKEKGKETANEMDGEFYYLDVTDKEQAEYVVQSIYEKYGKLSILCSNAGIFPQVSIENMTEKDWDKVQDINVKGTFFCGTGSTKIYEKTKLWTSNTDFFDYRTYYRILRMGSLWR